MQSSLDSKFKIKVVLYKFTPYFEHISPQFNFVWSDKEIDIVNDTEPLRWPMTFSVISHSNSWK